MIKAINRKIICYSILLAALSVICACILWKADWIFNSFGADDYQFVDRTAIGKPSHAFTGSYRFWPLGLCDYTILLFVPYGKTAMAHYIYNCVTMIFSVLMTLSLLNKITRNNYAISLFSLLILFLISSFMLVHILCIFSERMIFFMFSAFMLCSFIGYKKQSSLHYFLAFLTATYAIFLKEPVFGTVAIIALTNLIFSRTSIRDKIFNCSLLASSLSYIAIYVYRLFYRRDDGAPYAQIASSFSELSFNQFRDEPILYLMAIVVCARAYSLLIKKDRSQAFTDSLLFGGFGYAVVYSILLLSDHPGYYVFPAIVLFIPSFAVSLSENKNCRFAIISISILCSAITINTSVKYVFDTWKHREEDPLFFKRIVKEWQSGKNIYWITNSALENGPKNSHSNFIFPRYNMFLHYYGGEKCRLKKISDPNEINANSVVLCHEEMEQSPSFPLISKKIEECGLGLFLTIALTHIYLPK